MPVALELQHRVDYVLEHLGASNAPLFVDMPHEQHRRVGLLGKLQQRGGTLAHLPYTAGRRLHGRGGDGLYRVDDHDVRVDVADVYENIFERSLAHDIAVGSTAANALGAQLQLAGTLLARHI